MDDNIISLGQASAAVAMANSAIDNARRAAETSRSRRMLSREGDEQPPNHPFDRPSTPKLNPIPGTAEFVRNDSVHPDRSASKASADLDLKHNDNAYHVVATLVTDRLLPKLSANSTFYTVSEADVEFFDQMLPHSVRKAFVYALRYRLQNSSTDTPLGRLNSRCQMLGLDRDRNVLLDLGQGHGMTVSSNLFHSPIDIFSSIGQYDNPYRLFQLYYTKQTVLSSQ